MSGAGALSRRDLLRGALAGGVLCVGVQLVGGCGGAQARRIRRADATGELVANAYITILPSGVVAMALHKAEIGQGVATAYATLVAEELEVEPGEIDFHFADSLPAYRTLRQPGVPLFAIQATGGSTSVSEGFLPLRRAAAAAREMLVGAAAATWRVPARECVARAGQIHHEASGRALGYGELTRAAARQSAPDEPRLKAAKDFRFIGKHDRRVDARAKVTGEAIYGIDLVVPDMVLAYAIHPPRFGARPARVDADAARRSPGVIDVLTLPWGVAVVAAKYWQARRAAALVEVAWQGGAVLDSEALARAGRAHRGDGGAQRDDGDVGAALGRGDVTTIDAVYEVPFLAHAPLEPQNCVAAVHGRTAEIWAPCQSPSGVQDTVARELGIDPDDVLVHSTFSGGGFGRRLLSDYALQAVTIARKVGRPVKLIWSRESDMTQGFYRPAATTFVRGAVDRAGRATAFSFHSLSQPLAYDSGDMLRGGMPRWVPGFMRSMTAENAMALTGSNAVIDILVLEGVAKTPYRIPNLRVAYTPVNAEVTVASWRSVANANNAFAVESAMDELAHAAGQDPYAFRRAHLAPGSRELRVLDTVAKRAGWGTTRPPPGHAWGIARHTAFQTEAAEIAEVTIEDGRIRVTRVWCAVECGLVVNPDIVRSQIEGGVIFGLSAALDQAITIVDGVVRERNYDSFPVLRMHECPQVDVTIVPSEAPPTGVGEPGLPPIAPAVANALFTLTGKRLRRLPLQPSLDAEVGS